MRISVVVWLVAITPIAASCGGKSPTAPAPTTVPGQGQPTSTIVAVTGNTSMTPGQTTQLGATVTMAGGAILNISSSAQWSSSDESVVRVSAAGIATAAGIGSTDIAAVYQGVRSNTLHVAVVRPDPALTLSGTIRQAGNGRSLGGVTVNVRAGPTALTDDSGRYSIAVAANSTVFLTFSKDGFEPSNARVLFNQSGETTVDATLQPPIAISAGAVLDGTLFLDDPLYQLPTIDGDEYFCSPCKVVRVTATAEGLFDVHLSDSSDDLLRIFISDGQCASTCTPEPPIHVTAGQEIKVYVGPKGHLPDSLRFQLITSQRQE
jgi:hypothetical protein